MPMHSYGVFHPACQDEITMQQYNQRVENFYISVMQQIFSVFLHLFIRKSIPLAEHFTKQIFNGKNRNSVV
jgi:hypothetical protein